ncbi:DUF2332 domain-containing protein [Pelagovum pacificum]|uniref:DUF2332 domain-containing protein n=2 Tax=Pelagovum pacificum TaxID=2588711 RepID=A0A5C5GCJ6_9RHOB|nr:DUF2332 domain-containing protein [Pelagovum pacificum]TNY31692.1 DUF2332 domain-containing protein [Pelagovum pacificum]
MQSKACHALGSPFMGRLMSLFAERYQPGTPIADRLFAWPGVVHYGAASLPLRLAGALHTLKRRGNPTLEAVYPPHEVDDDTLWTAVTSVLVDHAGEIDPILDSSPQTNEVRRSTALLAAAHWLTGRYDMPFTLSELGASAGLNLMFDRFAMETPARQLGASDPALVLTPEWTGDVPDGPAPRVVERRGVDLRPVDLETETWRLLAYLWPDQHDRLARTEAAIAIAEGIVDQGDAADWIEDRLSRPWRGIHMIYHTIAWQYFPDETQARATAAIEAAGARATDEAPLFWLSVENDGDGGAPIVARLWPGDSHYMLGRMDAHGRKITWTGSPL